MKLLMLVFTTALSFQAFSQPVTVNEKERLKSWEKKIDAPKIGKIRMKFAYAGEPLAKPADLTVFLKCDGMKKDLQVYYRDICWVNTYEYEKGDKALLFQVSTARVDENSKVYCDQFTDETLKLEKLCQDAFKKGEK